MKAIISFLYILSLCCFYVASMIPLNIFTLTILHPPFAFLLSDIKDKAGGIVFFLLIIVNKSHEKPKTITESILTSIVTYTAVNTH